MAKRNFDPKIVNSMKSAAADSFAENIKMIDIDDLHESPDNFFDVERINELAETIYEQGGVLENLIVKTLENGSYEVVSGHRRTAAIRQLIKDGKKVSRYLPCLIRNYSDDDEKSLDIILMNVTARIINDAQMWKSYEIINEVLQKKKKSGERFGQIQKKLAELLGISTGQTAKLQSIDKNAVDEVKEALENGVISINTADKISKLGKDEQKELVAEKPLSQVKPKDVEKVIISGNFLSVRLLNSHNVFII